MADHECPACGAELKKCWSKKKEKDFWFCTAPQESCGEVFQDDHGKPVLQKMRKGEPDPAMPCPACGKPMQKITGTKNGDFWSCSAYPTCKATIDIVDDRLPPVCPEHPEHGHMRLRDGKNGKFFSCSQYHDGGCSAVVDFDNWKNDND